MMAGKRSEAGRVFRLAGWFTSLCNSLLYVCIRLWRVPFPLMPLSYLTPLGWVQIFGFQL